MAFLESIASNVLADFIFGLAMSGTVRLAMKGLFKLTLDKRQEIIFWLTAQMMLLLALLAIRVNAPSVRDVANGEFEVVNDRISSLANQVQDLNQGHWPRLNRDQRRSITDAFSPLKNRSI